MKRFAGVVWFLVLVSSLAADWPAGQATRHAYLEVIISNATGQDVDEAGVYFGTNSYTFGVVGAGHSKGDLGCTRPITTNATVRWVDELGAKKEQAVSLVDVYKPRIAGALTFVIGSTNVTVQFKKIERR